MGRPVRVRVRVRVSCSNLALRLGLGLGWVEAWDISKQRIPRSFHLRPFIVLTITKRAHYKAKSEATCRVSVL